MKYRVYATNGHGSVITGYEDVLDSDSEDTPTKEDIMQIILTPAGGHLPGAYTYRTDDQRLIGRIFAPASREDFVAALQQYRKDLCLAAIEADPLAALSESSRRYIERWIIGDGRDNSHRRI